MHDLREAYERYLNGECSKEELQELLHHFNGKAIDPYLLERIEQTLANDLIPEEDSEAVKSILTYNHEQIIDYIHNDKRKKLWTLRRLLPYAAAILVFLSIGIGIYRYNMNNQSPTQLTSQYGDDVLPGGNHAVLTLADGSSILLDSVSVGFLAEQSGMSITKSEDGIITYTMQSEEGMGVAGAVAFNTISTPRGGQYKVILPDSTSVWLNAASSLTYPTRFSGSERKVELNGEGYFEVTHNAAQPFIVQSNRQTIQVLGTSFNVIGYDNDPATTTLVNGSVRVARHRSDIGMVLTPGQQAEIMGEHIHVKDVDVRDYVSWKDGIIILNQTALSQVIRQIERWYDVEFEISDMPDARLNGVLHRNAKLSAILEVLEMNTDIPFRIEGRRIMANR